MAMLTHAGGRSELLSPAPAHSSCALPAQLQALCATPPYLPRPGDSALQQPEAELLDRQFRLLREDFVGPLRQELAQLGLAHQQQGQGQGQEQGQGQPAAAPGPQQQQQGAQHGWLSSGSRNVYRQVAVLGTCTKPRPCVMVSLELPAGHKAAGLPTKAKRLEFWKDFGRSTLPLDALVCLVLPGGELAFGTVARRDEAELAAEQRPMVGAGPAEAGRLPAAGGHAGQCISRASPGSSLLS
jgi:hypothetical protein